MDDALIHRNPFGQVHGESADHEDMKKSIPIVIALIALPGLAGLAWPAGGDGVMPSSPWPVHS